MLQSQCGCKDLADIQAKSDLVANGQASWPSQNLCEDVSCPNADQCSTTHLEEPEAHNDMSKDKVDCSGSVANGWALLQSQCGCKDLADIQAKSDSVANEQASWPSQNLCEDVGCPNADQCSKPHLDEPDAHSSMSNLLDLNDFNDDELDLNNIDFNDDEISLITHLLL